MATLTRLLLTDDLIAHIGLVRRSASLANECLIPYSVSEMERVDLANALVAAFIEQSAARPERLPQRLSALAPVHQMRLTPKRRRRA